MTERKRVPVQLNDNNHPKKVTISTEKNPPLTSSLDIFICDEQMTKMKNVKRIRAKRYLKIRHTLKHIKKNMLPFEQKPAKETLNVA